MAGRRTLLARVLLASRLRACPRPTPRTLTAAALVMLSATAAALAISLSVDQRLSDCRSPSPAPGHRVTLHLCAALPALDPGMGGAWQVLARRAGLNAALPPVSMARPDNLPPGAIDATVPLYPGAVPVAATASRTSGTVASAYLKRATAAYPVPAAAASVAAWYRDAFGRTGYATRDPMGAVTIWVRARSGPDGVTAPGSLRDPNLGVQVTILAVAPGQTMVSYQADDLAVPRRPRASYVAVPGVTRIGVVISPHDGGSRAPSTYVITAPAAIARIVAAYDILQPDIGSGHDCVPLTIQSVTLTMVRHRQTPATVTLSPGCGWAVASDGTRLAMSSYFGIGPATVWNLVADAGPH